MNRIRIRIRIRMYDNDGLKIVCILRATDKSQYVESCFEYYLIGLKTRAMENMRLKFT